MKKVESNPVFKVVNITKKFKKYKALNEVSFSIDKGSFHGLVGENGSGKSTIVKILLGTYSTEKYDGFIERDPNSSISFFPENATFPNNWKVYGYLLNIASMHIKNKKIAQFKVDKIMDEMQILEIKKKNPNSLSSGQKKKILLARAAIEDSDVLILDEPAANLDIASRKFLFNKLKEFNEKGKTIVIISHLLKEINEYINELTILNLGVLYFNGKIKEGKLENEYEKVFKKI